MAASLAAVAALALIFQDGTVRLPSLTVASGTVVLALFIPIPLVAGLMTSLESRLPGPEATGTRHVQAMDAALVIAAVALTTLLCIGLGAALGSSSSYTVGRNSMFLTGLMLCARPLMGRPAVMMPVAWLITTVLCGFRPGNDPRPWTIVPEPPLAPHAAVGALLTFLIGIAVQLHTSSRTLK
ncbi:hypothetical protein [Streptomyces himalayensis]|uniref:Uncharacterized protein n=1 Tax=Streptomyces himalayensis subsp. himalayensis TaxID=2756131 RepID=A0A7W0IBD2_9ACTN|nr:hypothetical protein [Streptomyces himalayensis]MBA2949277.1 hypothetical protein [Streptomyces himalayensis subsp. himalayensis]